MSALILCTVFESNVLPSTSLIFIATILHFVEKTGMVCVSLKSWVVTIQAVLQPISTAVVGATLMIIGIVGLREQNEEAEEEEALQNDIVT